MPCSQGKIDRKLLPRSTSPEAKRLAAFDEDDAGPPLVLPATPTETAVLEIWAEMLRAPKEEISCSDEFFDIGGHSLLATRVMARLVQEFSLPSGSLTLAQLIGAPTVQGMAALVDVVQAGEDAATSAEAADAIDLAAEAVLDPSIYPATSRKADHYSRFRLSLGAWSLSPRAIFLTGATGYLGAHILAEMLTGSEVTVFCLVRAESRAEGRARLTDTLRGYRLLEPVLQSLAKQVRPPSPLIPNKPRSAADGAEGTPERKKQKSTLTEDEELLQELLQARIVPVLGDLSKPLLGIADGAFRSLATEVDSILHCGADVNLVKAYASLKPANVLGTQEVLRLAVTQGLNRTKVKPVVRNFDCKLAILWAYFRMSWAYLRMNVFGSTTSAPTPSSPSDVQALRSQRWSTGGRTSRWKAKQLGSAWRMGTLKPSGWRSSSCWRRSGSGCRSRCCGRGIWRAAPRRARRTRRTSSSSSSKAA